MPTKIHVNGEELTSDYPPIHEMIQMVQMYIAMTKGVQVNIKIDINSNKELAMLELAYTIASQHIPRFNFNFNF